MQKYGLEYREYTELAAKQNNRCAICGTHESECLRGVLYVDHDHATGKVRGLLCHGCNTILGIWKDDVEILRRAIAYLGVAQAETIGASHARK
jgi:MinD superfamily P-loop ATPase